MSHPQAKAQVCAPPIARRIPDLLAELVALLRRCYPNILHFALIGEAPDGNPRHELRIPCPDPIPLNGTLWPSTNGEGVAGQENPAAVSLDDLVEAGQKLARMVRQWDPTADHMCLLISRPGLDATSIPIRLVP